MARMSFDDCEIIEPNKYKLVLMTINLSLLLQKKSDPTPNIKSRKLIVSALNLIAKNEFADHLNDDDLYYQQ